MKFLVLNLPYKEKIIRKFSCSYHARGFLYPPVELVRLATIIKENFKNSDTLEFYDAVAKKDNDKKSIKKILSYKPDCIFTLLSVDFLQYEITFLKKLQKFIDAPVILIGYIPSLYPDLFDELGFVLGNNFETVIFNAMRFYSANEQADFIESLKVFQRNKLLEHEPDLIKYHDIEIIEKYNYSELFASGKTAFTYWSFGCPYSCSFCVRTYNISGVKFRKTENIFEELKYYNSKGVKNIRLLDDNCTLRKKLLKDIYNFQKENNINFKYYGLTRIDLLDDEVVDLLIGLNFRHVMIGLESINEDSRRIYNKTFKTETDKAEKHIKRLRKNKIDVSYFLLFNPLNENFEDIKSTVKYLRDSSVSFASLSFLIPYPGTEIFKSNSDYIKYDLYPLFRWRWKTEFYTKLKKYETYFFINFYLLSFFKFSNLLRQIISHPFQSACIFKDTIKFYVNKKRDREDYF